MESATLDLPGIDESLLATTAAPATPKTEVATAAASAIDLDKLDLSTLALSKFGRVRKQLADATKALTGTVHDLSTQAKVDDAKSLRQRLLNAPLADARKVSKGLKSKLKSVSDAVGAELEVIEAAFTEAAKLITPQIDARELELAAEKAEREAKEAARRKEFEDKVAVIHGYLTAAQSLPSPRIQKGIEFLVAMTFGDEWAEFKAIAEKARDTTLTSLRELLAKVQADEAAAQERERIKAENEALRAENERLAAEQRAEAARLKAESDALAAERAELARQREAIAAAQLAAAPAPEVLIEPAAAAPVPAESVAATITVEPYETHRRPGGGFVTNLSHRSMDVPAPAALAAALDAELDDSALKFDSAVASALADQVNGGLGLGVMTVHADPDSGEIVAKHVPLIDVVKADPVDEGAALAPATLPLLLAHIAKAFDTKFQSQPKPSIEWWEELKRLAGEVSA